MSGSFSPVLVGLQGPPELRPADVALAFFVLGTIMAGPWIKLEYATPDKLEVRTMAKSLNLSRLHVFGLCFKFWCWCDAQLSDGHLIGFSVDDIDEIVAQDGFCSAMLEVGWLQMENDRIIVTNFDRHLGNSAKNRAVAAKRQATKRTRKPR